MLGFAAYFFERLYFSQKTDPLRRKARAIQCTIQNWDCIRIVHQVGLAFLHTGYNNTSFVFIVFAIIHTYIYIYCILYNIYLYIYMLVL